MTLVMFRLFKSIEGGALPVHPLFTRWLQSYLRTGLMEMLDMQNLCFQFKKEEKRNSYY